MLLTSSWILDLLILCGISTILIFIYFTRNFNYWKKRGLYCPKPIPLFGNVYDSFTFKTTIHENFKKYYDSTNDPFFGMYILDEPVLVLKSPELIKDVLIKDFYVFCDRRVATPKHPDMAYSVFFLIYNLWKKVRTTLSPLFRASMLKNNYFHIDNIQEELIKFLHRSSGVIDARLIGGHFSTELLARWFFEINPHCFDEEGSLFRQSSHNIFDFNIRNAIIQNLFFIKTSWVSFFGLDFIENQEIQFFKSMFKASLTIKSGYDGNLRNLADLGHKGVKELEEQKNKSPVLDIAVSNSIFFLIAGIETSSTFLAFTLYELAVNQNAQDTLRREVEINFQKHGEFTQEGVKDNKYMEMCLNGRRLGLMALSIVISNILMKFKLEKCNKTPEKIEFEPKNFALISKTGLPVKIIPLE